MYHDVPFNSWWPRHSCIPYTSSYQTLQDHQARAPRYWKLCKSRNPLSSERHRHRVGISSCFRGMVPRMPLERALCNAPLPLVEVAFARMESALCQDTLMPSKPAATVAGWARRITYRTQGSVVSHTKSWLGF